MKDWRVMAGPRHTRGTPLRYVAAESDLENFEALLNTAGVTVAVGSVLEEIFLVLTEYLSQHRRESHLDPRADRRLAWLRMLGLVDLARKMLRARMYPDFHQLVPHLRLLSGADVDPSQNAPTSTDDQANHKLFELLMAAAAMGFGSNVELESPRATGAGNPDVLFDYNGTRWGIPCRVLHSSRVATYRDRVMNAIKQIDASTAERGLVVVNVKHLADLDRFRPFGRLSADEPYEVFEDDTYAPQRVREFQVELRDRLGDDARNLGEAFRGSRAVPAVCHYFQAMYLIRREGQPRMSPFVMTQLLGIGVELDAELDELMQALNGELQWG